MNPNDVLYLLHPVVTPDAMGLLDGAIAVAAALALGGAIWMWVRS